MLISVFLTFILWSIHLISSFSQFFSKESVFYTFLADFCFYIIQKLKLCPYRLFWQILFWHQKSWCLTTFFPVVTEDFSIYVFNIFFSRCITYCKPTSENWCEIFFRTMGDELNDWKRQASVSVQVWHLLHLRDRFSPTLFYSFLFEEAADEVEWTTVEKIWKSSTRNKKWNGRLLIILTFHHAFIKSKGSYS